METGQGTWEEPEGFHHRGDHLCKEEIQVLLLSQLYCFSLYFHFAGVQFNFALLSFHTCVEKKIFSLS